MATSKDLPLSEAPLLKKKWGIDTRFVVFEYETIKVGKKQRYLFTVSSEYLKDRLQNFFIGRRLKKNLQIKLLPELTDFSRPFLVCNASVAPVMAKPNHTSEQTTQFLIGESADILEDGGKFWWRLRLHQDGYIGWVSKNQVVQYSPEELSLWAETKKIQSRARITYLFKTRSKTSEPIRELIMGVQLPVSETRGRWAKVILPDHEYGWCRKDEIQNVRDEEKRFNSRILLKTAKSFLGIPYLWGARSVKAFDCSGFVQTSFHLHGFELPRDASLQWRCGDYIGKDYKKFIEGDLLFFSLDGKKITHVAISLGNDGRFIHASGYVRCNSLNPVHRIYSKERTVTFIGARRVGLTS